MTLQTLFCVTISAGVNGGLSGGSSVRRPGSQDPHRRQRNFLLKTNKDDMIYLLHGFRKTKDCGQPPYSRFHLELFLLPLQSSLSSLLSLIFLLNCGSVDLAINSGYLTQRPSYRSLGWVGEGEPSVSLTKLIYIDGKVKKTTLYFA